MDQQGFGRHRRSGQGLGGRALLAGTIAVAALCVPAVGDFIAGPAAVLAIVLGWIGFDRAGRGLASDGGMALVGGGLGLLAGFLIFLVIVATTAPSHP